MVTGAIMSLLSQGKFLRKNAKKIVSGVGGDYFLINGVSVAQGPNYILAKRMQHWRAVIARSQGCTVSSNIAPSTSTVSVTQNRTFAWAYEGMPYFKPYEIFAPETSNAVMSAILFHDLNDTKSVANPKSKVSNPNQLFSYNSFVTEKAGGWTYTMACSNTPCSKLQRHGRPLLGPNANLLAYKGMPS